MDDCMMTVWEADVNLCVSVFSHRWSLTWHTFLSPSAELTRPSTSYPSHRCQRTSSKSRCRKRLIQTSRRKATRRPACRPSPRTTCRATRQPRTKAATPRASRSGTSRPTTQMSTATETISTRRTKTLIHQNPNLPHRCRNLSYRSRTIRTRENGGKLWNGSVIITN